MTSAGPVCPICGDVSSTVRGHRPCLACREAALDSDGGIDPRGALVVVAVILTLLLLAGALTGCTRPRAAGAFRADVELGTPAAVSSDCGPADGQHCGCASSACQRPCSTCCREIPCQRADGPPTCAR